MESVTAKTHMTKLYGDNYTGLCLGTEEGRLSMCHNLLTFFLFSFFGLFFFLWPHPQHMEILRLGASEL